MFYEIRRYQSQPGRRQEWVRYMEEVVIPFQASKGIDVVASFTDEQDGDGYVWIRRRRAHTRLALAVTQAACLRAASGTWHGASEKPTGTAPAEGGSRPAQPNRPHPTLKKESS